jgi:hypothetical protein
MQFNKPVKQLNTNYNTQVANKEEALRLISEIDKFLDYVDDTSEYDQIKLNVQRFEPIEYQNMVLNDQTQQSLQQMFNRLEELANTLK